MSNSRTKQQEKERREAIQELRGIVKPGDTLFTILRHVSRSGMSRRISVYTKDHQMIDWLVARATGFSLAKEEGLSVGGCGMDMGFHLVNSLSEVLYGGYGRTDSPGYQCLGKDGGCPSNYHVNHRDTIRCEGLPEYNVYITPPDIGGTTVRAASADGSEYLRFPSRESAEEYAKTLPENFKAEVEADYLHCWRSETMELPHLSIEGIDIPQGKAHVIRRKLANGEESQVEEICPVCEGFGRIPNPEGPERWDLLHTDGYAVRQRWL